MTKIVTKVFILIMCVCLSACTGAKNSTSGNDEAPQKLFDGNRAGPTDQILANYLRTISRLQVSGSPGNYFVTNRVSSTLQGDKRPLFVVDGVQMGRDFNRITNLVQLQSISSIEFLRANQATFKYGEAGRNGVVMINYIGSDNNY